MLKIVTLKARRCRKVFQHEVKCSEFKQKNSSCQLSKGQHEIKSTWKWFENSLFSRSMRLLSNGDCKSWTLLEGHQRIAPANLIDSPETSYGATLRNVCPRKQQTEPSKNSFEDKQLKTVCQVSCLCYFEEREEREKRQCWPRTQTVDWYWAVVWRTRVLVVPIKLLSGECFLAICLGHSVILVVRSCPLRCKSSDQ